MSRPIEVEMVSTLSATRDEVWRSVSTMKGVNFELHPYVHMTSPAEHQSLPHALKLGHVVFRSWLLMFGLVPFDRHSLALELVDEGHRFCRDLEHLAATTMAPRTSIGRRAAR